MSHSNNIISYQTEPDTSESDDNYIEIKSEPPHSSMELKSIVGGNPPDVKSINSYERPSVKNDKQINNNNVAKGYTQIFPRILLRDPLYKWILLRSTGLPWMDGSATLLENETELKKALTFTQLLNGSQTFINTIWPLVLAGLMGRDISNLYNVPENRYGNRFRDIFFGVSANQDTWSSHFGSDLITEYLYYLAPVTLIAGPVVSGLLNLALTPALNEHTYDDVLRDLYVSNTCRDVCRLLLPYPDSFFPALSKAEFMVRWDDRPDKKQDQNQLKRHNLLKRRDPQKYQKLLKCQKLLKRHALLTGIINVAMHHNSLAQLYAFDALANIADHYPHPATRIQQKALDALRGFSTYRIDRNLEAEYGPRRGVDFKPSRLLFSNYKLFTLNRTHQTSLQILFGSLAAFKVYAGLRAIEIFYQKGRGLYDYFSAKAECEAVGKLWNYIDQIADYACTVCEVGPNVRMIDALTSQGCFDSLLTQVQPVETLLNAVKRLIQHPDFNTLDLSLQPWMGWSLENWNAFLSTLESAPTLQLSLFNLSRAVMSPLSPEDGKIQRLAEFLRKVVVKQLDLINCNLGPKMLEQLMPGLKNNHTRYLALSNNALTDTAAPMIAEILRSALSLQILLLASNRFMDAGMKLIGAALTNSTVRELVANDNALNAEGIAALIDSACQGLLRKLHLANIPHTLESMAKIGESLRCLEAIELASCELDDSQIIVLSPYLRDAVTRYYGFSSNAIGEAMTDFITGLPDNGTAVAVDFANNLIGDSTLAAATTLLTKKGIDTLLLQGNRFTIEGFKVLMQNIIGSALRILNVANNELGNTAGRVFSSTVIGNSTALQHVDFTQTGIGQGALEILRGADATNITEIRLGGNEITDEVIVRARNYLSHFELLDLHASGLTGIAGDVIAALLATPNRLKTLLLSYNPIGNDAIYKIATQLVKPLPHIREIGQKILSRDLRRALNPHDSHPIPHGEPSGNLTTLAVRDTESAEAGNNALCTVQSAAKIPTAQLKLSAIDSCQTSAAAHRAEPIVTELYKGVKIFFEGAAEGVVRSAGAIALTSGLPVLQKQVQGLLSQGMNLPLTFLAAETSSVTVDTHALTNAGHSSTPSFSSSNLLATLLFTVLALYTLQRIFSEATQSRTLISGSGFWSSNNRSSRASTESCATLEYKPNFRRN